MNENNHLKFMKNFYANTWQCKTDKFSTIFASLKSTATSDEKRTQ